MSDVPRSEQFDDVYFSVADGLAETRHVFLDGNDLPARWRARAHFTICETGFGTGLNFLAALKLWREDEGRPATFHFVSFEKYPVDRDFIDHHLSHWPEISEELADLLSVYPRDISSGVHRLCVCEGVTLTLIFGDVNDEIPTCEQPVDCWFLDGFKPSANPGMWSDAVFKNMARLSVPGASFATFTAAGFVRRGLEAAGFEVRKVPGFGRKREMCVGRKV